MEALRIACVYRAGSCASLQLAGMDTLRFFRMSEALARRGHRVDIVIDRNPEPRSVGPNLSEVPFRAVRWRDYDVVKTFFHVGFESLRAAGGAQHPFIVSKLGSVVGRANAEGVYFFGAVREHLFATQREIARTSRSVTVLTERSAALWRREHGSATRLLLVPTGVDAEIPPPGGDPRPRHGVERPVVLFAGNIYGRASQPEVNAVWQERLNRLGVLVAERGLQLVAMGRGETDRLDPRVVRHLGPVDADEVWDWQRHASVGLVLAHGPIQDNESSKIYYYLRTGLPVVCERSVPNSPLIEHTGLGALVAYGDDERMADAAAELAAHPPSANGTIEHMVRDHSWDARAALYDTLLLEARRIRMTA